MRPVFHRLRSASIENFDGQCKGLFDLHGPLPTKGLTNTQRFALGAVFVSHLALWYRHDHDLDPRVGLNLCLKAARGIVTGPRQSTTRSPR